MNKFEKEAIKMLSEEEREKIVGGTEENDELTNEQCESLQHAISKLSDEQKIQILKPYLITSKVSPAMPPPLVKYGLFSPRPQHLLKPTKDKGKTNEN